MNIEEHISVYSIYNCITFMKSTDKYGLLANTTMNNGAVKFKKKWCRSSENVYHAFKFPDNHALQDILLYQRGSMDSKMLSRDYDDQKREDWEEVSFAVN